MKINGIIAEYNPFHNGHRYQLEESKRRTNADYTIAVISGNFVQRGAPAILSKHARAEMALKNGVDLVLELPSVYAVSSAEYFAAGAVSLLNQLNVVTHLCFGSECGEIQPLKEIADVLAQEPEAYSCLFKSFLQSGHSYPSARAAALSQYFGSSESTAELLSTPNNCLGIEYLKALLRQNSPIIPCTVKRRGSGYHSPLPHDTCCSALAIRQALFDKRNLSDVQGSLPEVTLELLQGGLTENRFVHCNDFSAALYYKLLSEKEYGFEKYLDVSADLSNRIVNRLNEYQNFEAFCDLLKTKELTHTRISRCLLHILLNLTDEDMAFGQSVGYTPYARVLGFRMDASELLSHIKRSSSIPLITKLSDGGKLLDENAVRLLQKDIQTSQLYYGIATRFQGSMPANEYTIPLVIV